VAVSFACFNPASFTIIAFTSCLLMFFVFPTFPLSFRFLQKAQSNRRRRASVVEFGSAAADSSLSPGAATTSIVVDTASSSPSTQQSPSSSSSSAAAVAAAAVAHAQLRSPKHFNVAPQIAPTLADLKVDFDAYSECLSALGLGLGLECCTYIAYRSSRTMCILVYNSHRPSFKLLLENVDTALGGAVDRRHRRRVLGQVFMSYHQSKRNILFLSDTHR
jgi:hypothetical protein